MIDQASQLRRHAQSQEVRMRTPAAVPAAILTGGSTACRSIAITSGKGGVGKSNISLLLAQALARLNKRVLLFDADLGLANIHILLGMNVRHNLAHAIRGECTFDDVVCGIAGGVNLIPGASGIEALANLDALALESLVRSLSSMEARHDFMVIDIGAGIGQTAMRLSQSADTALLVLTPEPTSLADAYATAKILFSRGMKRVGVIVNMARAEKEGSDIYEKLASLVDTFLQKKLFLAAILPYDKDIPRFVRAQRTLFIEKPKSLIATRISGYARLACGMQTDKKGNFFTRFFASA